uniref:BIG2 domain-containing protein n=1 Tax=uncultured Armatimonadetes bacterium TaxID=157466 RepID=A0A6J4JIL5_9BACT|nr:hypothetical protein AVDCRST_MAG63-3569 [uncultured Armatimonadetes bacterium]
MKYLSICVLFAFALSLLAGCGGGGSNAADANKGAASFTVVWPERSRLIPLRAESIKIDATQGGRPVATSQVVARPASGTNTSTVTFPQLPIGNVDITATAYPAADATGTAQAVGSVTVRINPDQTTQATLTMGSTIASLVLSVGTDLGFTVGDFGLTIQVSARDVNGDVVLLPTDDSPPTLPSTLSFQSTDTGVVTVDADGFVTPVASGDAQIIVTETESTVTAAVNVRVRGQVASLQFEQANPSVPVGGVVPLSVIAKDNVGNEVPIPADRIRYETSDPQTATVTPGGEGAPFPGGRVTGVKAGTVTITATDPATGLTATTTVTVTAGGGAGALVVSPSEVTLPPDGQQQFTATIDGQPVAVNWSVSGGGSVSGSIDDDGLYTAPPVDPGVPLTVTAETADNKTATATVTIQEDDE